MYIRPLISVVLFLACPLSLTPYSKTPESDSATMASSSESPISIEFSDYTEPRYNIDMVAVKGGTFIMGTPPAEKNRDSDEWQYQTSVSDYYIGKYEVTQKLWIDVMGSYPGEAPSTAVKVGDNYPVYYISWYDAIEFCNQLSEKTGRRLYYTINKKWKDPNNKNVRDGLKWTVTLNSNANGYRLPTETEWEYAARGGANSKGYLIYSGSNDIKEVGHCCYDDRYAYPMYPVGDKKQPNALGIYDMSGNVWEWCGDWYGSYSNNVSKTDPTGATSGHYRVNRGGSWNRDYWLARAGNRNDSSPTARSNNIGFRIACNSDT